MDHKRLLLAKQDLQNYSHSQIKTLARSLGMENSNYDDLLWQISLKLHGNNTYKAEMPSTNALIDIPLNDVDVWMARFAWTANQNVDSLSKKEQQEIEALLEDYRLYLQNGEQNPNSMRKKIQAYIYAPSQSRKLKSVVTAEQRPLVQVATMYGDNRDPLPVLPVSLQLGSDADLIPASREDVGVHTVDTRVQLTQRERKGIRRELRDQYDQMPEGEEKDLARQELFGPGGRKEFKPETLAEVYQAMRVHQEQMMTTLGQHLGQLQETGTATTAGNIAVEERLVRVEKMTAEMAKQMNDLHTAQIQQQSLTQVAWYNLPKKIKLAFAQGFKRGLLFAAMAPITFPAAIVKNIILNPMAESFDFFSRWIRIAWGTILWVVVISGCIHVYYYSDRDYVNEILNSPLVTGTYNYITIIVRPAFEYLPASETIRAEFGRLWADLGGDLVNVISEQLINLKDWLWEQSILVLCALLMSVFKDVWGIGGALSSACSDVPLE